MDELLDCPFCGGEAYIRQWRDTLKPNAAWVECVNPDCHAMTQTYYDEDPAIARQKAVAAWSRRVMPPLPEGYQRAMIGPPVVRPNFTIDPSEYEDDD